MTEIVLAFRRLVEDVARPLRASTTGARSAQPIRPTPARKLLAEDIAG